MGALAEFSLIGLIGISSKFIDYRGSVFSEQSLPQLRFTVGLVLAGDLSDRRPMHPSRIDFSFNRSRATRPIQVRISKFKL